MDNIITAQELKTKGTSVFNKKMKAEKEAIITVRGKNEYVVLTMDRYNFLRECELDAALTDTTEDVKKGRFKTQSVDQHITSLKNV